MSDSDYNWTSEDEKEFILQLPADSAVRYCTLVLEQPRRWDPTVDVGEVMRFAGDWRRRMLATASGHRDVIGGVHMEVQVES